MLWGMSVWMIVGIVVAVWIAVSVPLALLVVGVIRRRDRQVEELPPARDIGRSGGRPSGGSRGARR